VRNLFSPTAPGVVVQPLLETWRTNLRIGMVLKARIPPPDIRVEKEARTLVSAGHEVFLLLERGHEQQVVEEWKGMILNRVVEMGFLREKIHRYTFSFTFRDGLWRDAIEKFARDNRVDVLHVHDLPLVGEVLGVGRKLGLPVVADLHENYPAGLQVWYTNRLKKWTIYNYRRWASYEKKVVSAVDAVIVVVEEAKERVKGLGVDESRIYVVPNTASRDREEIPVDEEIIDRYRDDFVLSYIGGFAPHRGLDTAVMSLQHLKGKVKGLKLVLVGDRNRAYREYLERLAKSVGCSELVEFTGWQPFEKIWSYIRASDICLVPHARNPHTDSTIPHKIFQYMMVAKPVIVSDCPPLRRVVEESGGGLWFRFDRPEELAARVLELYDDPEKRKEVGLAGQRAFYERFNWDATSRPLLDLYERLERRG